MTTLLVGPDGPESMLIIKNLSAVRYCTEEWHQGLRLRNRVEERNDWVQSDEATDIAVSTGAARSWSDENDPNERQYASATTVMPGMSRPANQLLRRRASESESPLM